MKEDLTLGDRVYACATCGIVIDRDLNAAINLVRWTPDEQKPNSPPPLEAA